MAIVDGNLANLDFDTTSTKYSTLLIGKLSIMTTEKSNYVSKINFIYHRRVYFY